MSQPSGIPKVGFVGFASAEVDASSITNFRKGLKELGYVEGRTIDIRARSANGDVNAGLAMIDELAALPVDVFLSPGPAAARAIVRRTKIPVVAVALPAISDDPDLFRSFARPGGRVTGLSAFGEEMSAKRIELLRLIMPRLARVGIIHNATDPTFSAWGERTASDARAAGLEPTRIGLTAPSLDQLSEQLTKLGSGSEVAAIVIRDFMTSAMRSDICRMAGGRGIAVVGEHAEMAEAGALFSYGADLADLFRRAAGYVDAIIKGRSPAEMPIQLPTKFEFVVNGRSARTLGLAIPSAFMVLSDKIIE